MKHLLSILFCITILTGIANAQTFSLKGRITDKASGEGLVGASIQVKNKDTNTGGVTDANGNFSVSNLKPGDYAVTGSYIGYISSVQNIVLSKDMTISIRLEEETSSLGEVEIVADVAIERQTPVAFSAIKETTLRESLGARDLPLILNETPGVYATQGSGGTGDSRINIRGFSQRNVAVMINGVPVNDMENGQVYWSNWDLGDVTKTMQVQRGLSASKLATPSVGGTINLITKGFDARKGGKFRQEIGNNGYSKTSLMLSSGVLKGDWAVTVYGARRFGDGWVKGTFDDAYSYFGTISKKIGDHKFTLTGVGTPQSHGQRSFAQKIAVYDHEKAIELGANTKGLVERGFDYNPHWNTLNRYTTNGTDTTHNKQFITERLNYFHKPQVNLNHFWNVSQKLFISNVVYGSYGRGGGVGPAGTAGGSSTFGLDATGQTRFQAVYNQNRNTINRDIDPNERHSRQFLRASVNNHRWFGFVSSADYKINSEMTLSAGVDGRDYLGEHYQKVYDLLGGDYALDINYRNPGTRDGDQNSDPTRKLRVGDKYRYNYDGKTRQFGGYTMLEYKSNLLSAFASGTLGTTSYKRIDYFKPKVVQLADTSFRVPFGRTVSYKGTTYTNSDAKFIETDWVNVPGYTIKGGANYNLNEYNNIFVNVGWLNRPQFFSFIFDDVSGERVKNINNEKVASFELGYGISQNAFKANINAYHTLWFDRSTKSQRRDAATEKIIYFNVAGMNARHSGVELEIAQEITRQLQLNSAISLGDWTWTSTGTSRIITEDNEDLGTVTFNAKGVHVGDAAQNQFMFGLRYEPIKNLYFRSTFTLFSKFYADFDPTVLPQSGDPQDVYRMPTTRNVDLHYGYNNIKLYKNMRMTVNGSIINILNQYFITDVRRADGSNSLNPYNINSMEVFFNRGRTYTLGASLEF